MTVSCQGPIGHRFLGIEKPIPGKRFVRWKPLKKAQIDQVNKKSNDSEKGIKM